MIQQILNREEVIYASNLNEAHLKKRIEDLFAQGTLRLAGKLVNDNEFTAYDQRVVIGWNVPNLKRQAAYLRGKIVKGKDGSLINLTVIPNSILPIFAIASTLSGSIITLLALLNSGESKFFLILGLVFMVLGIIYYPASTLLRNQLRNKIVKYLDLSKV